MTSQVLISDDNPEIWNLNISKGGKTYSLDFTIGNKDYLGRGNASPTLEAFCKFFKSEVDKEVKQFFIDPDENNPRAKHVYSKAGFLEAGSFEMPEGFFEGHKSHLMIKIV